MIERKMYNGGINTDDAVDFIEQGDCLSAMNIRKGKDSDGNASAIKPVVGTTLRASTGLETTTIVLGAIADPAKRRIYWIVWDSGGLHRILAWDRESFTNYIVFLDVQVDTGLNFGQHDKVNGIAILGDFLYFTANLNQPRRINVERGIKTNHAGYTSQNGDVPEAYTVPLKELDITVARHQAVFPPTIERIVSADDVAVTNRTVNNIEGNSFQFATRYIFKSAEQSTFSPYSKLVRHNRKEDDYDTVRVEMPATETLYDEIQTVEFMVRKGNVGSWHIIKTFDRRIDSVEMDAHPGTPLGFYFYNDDVGTAVADAEALVPFHDVPIYSKGLEIAQHRLFLANNEKGRDFASGITITATPVFDMLEITDEFWLLSWTCSSTGADSRVLVKINTGDAAGWYSTPLSTPVPATYTLLGSFYMGSLADFPTTASLVDYFVVDSVCGTTSGESNVLQSSADFTIWGVSIVTGDPVFKAATNRKVGMVFFDEYGRNGGVLHDPTEVSITERTFGALFGGNPVSGISWSVVAGPDLNIPIWATHASLVLSEENKYSFFIAHYVNAGGLRYVEYDDANAEYDITGGETVYDETIHDGISIDTSKLLRDGIGYIFEEGDRVKMIVAITNTVYELTVIGQQGIYVIASPEDIGEFTVSYYFEIYRGITDTTLYREIGDAQLITSPGTSSRAFSVTSGVISGNVSLVARKVDEILTGVAVEERYSVERMNPNDKTWSIWDTDEGRPNLVLFSEQRRYETDFANSGIFFPGTETNDLNAFLSGDSTTLDSAIGAVQKLIYTSRTAEYGTVMLVLGNSEVASIYLGRSEYFTANEGSSVLQSADVVGTVNVLRGGFGTINPESAVENDGNVYWFSAQKAAFARYNLNGVFPISEFKFSAFSKWLANKILSGVTGVDYYFIYGGFDEFHREYVCTTPLETAADFPITYEALEDLDEEVTLTGDFVLSVIATLEAGCLYKFVYVSEGDMTLTVSDLYYGSQAYTFLGDGELQFFANINGENTFSIALIAPIKSFTLKLYKQRANPYLQSDGIPKTVSFSENNNRWESNYRFVPEWFSKIDDVLYSFKNGVIWSHDSSTKGSFYAKSYRAWIAMPVNQDVNAVKKYKNISIESDVVPDYVHLRTELPNIQSTDLLGTEFEQKEGVFYSDFKNDRLSPNTSGTAYQKMLAGDDMKSRYGKVLLEWNRLTNFVCRIFNVNTRQKAGHKT